jgi:hypothetical protein
MPTPVNHLVMAQQLLRSNRLRPPIQRFLTGELGPFLLGHTAPDAQTVSGQPRRETHFYTIPPSSDTPAYRTLLQAYPELAQSDRLAPAHAAFLAGYVAHLLVDEKWWRDIFHPFFGPEVDWGDWPERLFLHNVLRTWLDRQDQERLDGGEAEALRDTRPRGWLPFIVDEVLEAWRDLLVEQLQPGRQIRTAEVFAARMHLAAETVEMALGSPERMAGIFERVSQQRLRAYRSEALRQSAALINTYLEGRR